MTIEVITLIISVSIAGIAVIGLLVALFYFIFSESRARRDEQAQINQRVSTLEGRFAEWSPIMQSLMPDILLGKRGNPDGEREELLRKWKSGTLNYEESVILRDILAREAEQSEETWKGILALGLLALFLYALTKK